MPFARRKFKESYERARSSLQSVLSPLDFNHICSTLETKASKLKDRLSRKLEVKFNNLERKCGIPLGSNLNSDDIICNYSHRVLTGAEKMVLARGLRFWLPLKKLGGCKAWFSYAVDTACMGHVNIYWRIKICPKHDYRVACKVELSSTSQGKPAVVCKAAESFEDEA